MPREEGDRELSLSPGLLLHEELARMQTQPDNDHVPDAQFIHTDGGISVIEQLPQSSGKILGFQMSGKLHDEDYKTFVPMIDAAIAKEGKVRLLALFHDFHGWDAHALWDDIKFSTTHCTKIERIALVGEKTWEKWMSKVCKPFTMAKIRYFDATELEAAKAWLAEAK